MTPWHYERTQIGVAFIVMEGERFIGAVDMEKDAKRIVDAVNAHDDLLAACKRVVMEAEHDEFTVGCEEDLYAAISKAEGWS